ncbi:MAG: response regulator [Planctomycetes bacterium]|nr:response regulator [Planctomycetota bacterium]
MAASRVLVVDDNPVTRGVIREILEPEGHQVEESATGEAALESLLTRPVDLVIHDLRLPDTDGFTLFDRIRLLPHGTTVPVILATGDDSIPETPQFAARAFADFLLKPIEPGTLLEVVQAHLPVAPPERRRGRGRRLLVVDDNATNLRLATLYFRQVGFQVATACSGAQALAEARRRPPDLILSDVVMPESDGFWLCAEVRKDPALQGTPLVLASAMAPEEADRQRARAAGANVLVSRLEGYRSVSQAVSAALGDVAPVPGMAREEPAGGATTQRATSAPPGPVDQLSELMRRMARQSTELNLFAWVASTLSHQPAEEMRGDDILHLALSALGESVGALLLARPDGHWGAYTLPAQDAVLAGAIQRLADDPEGLRRRVAAGAVETVPGREVESTPHSELLRGLDAAEAALIPIVARGQGLGLLAIGLGRTPETRDRRLRIARSLAAQIALSLELARTMGSLARSENRYRSLVEAATDAIVSADAEGRIILWNAKAQRLFGHSADAILGRSLTSLMPDRSQAAHIAGLARVAAGGVPSLIGRVVEVEARAQDGREFPIELALSMTGEGPERVFTAVIRDVASRKALERRLDLQRDVAHILAESGAETEVLSRVLEAICTRMGWQVAGLWSYDEQNRVLGLALLWTPPAPAWHAFAHASKALVFSPGLGVPGRVLSEDRTTWIPDVRECTYYLRRHHARDAGLSGTLAVPVRAGGAVIAVLDFLATSLPCPDDDLRRVFESIGALVGQFLQRKRAENELRQAQFALDRAGDAIFWLAPDGRILYVNERAVELAGRSLEELLTLRIPDIDPNWPDEKWPEIRARVQAAGALTFESTLARKDGTRTPIEVSCKHLRFGATEFFCAFVRDLTGRRALEDQLRQSQKMEALGLLAGGVAHDFNNLLSAIIGFADLLTLRLASDPKGMEYARLIQQAGESASTLTQQLLAFGRKQVRSPQVLNPGHVAASMSKLLVRTIGEHIQVTVAQQGSCGEIRADRGQLEQVLLNLSVNARDAMGEAGSLTIETRNRDLVPGVAPPVEGMPPGPYVELSATDTGCGMDERLLARIFEPFFTTKEPGKGTGLGLAMVYGIVKQNEGFIAVRSRPGEGSCFRLFFPRVAGVAEIGSVTADPSSSSAGKETILVVDDERLVRCIAAESLRRAGYTVLECSGPQHALQVALDHPESIQLLLTDVVMPGMTGTQLAQELQRTRNDLRVLYMSGYVDRGIVTGGEVAAGIEFLQKPFTASSLCRRVREILDSQPKPP